MVGLQYQSYSFLRITYFTDRVLPYFTDSKGHIFSSITPVNQHVFYVFQCITINFSTLDMKTYSIFLLPARWSVKCFTREEFINFWSKKFDWYNRIEDYFQPEIVRITNNYYWG